MAPGVLPKEATYKHGKTAKKMPGMSNKQGAQGRVSQAQELGYDKRAGGQNLFQV
jgi:hypothetical protein